MGNRPENSFRLLILFWILCVWAVVGCASSQQVVEEYRPAISLNSNPLHHTTIFFMVDGFSYEEFRRGLSEKRLSNIENFFISPHGKIYQGQSIFPTLTFPNSASFLTRLPVDQHGINGNQVLTPSGSIVDFTSPDNVETLNTAMRGKIIFSDLKNQGKNSVSLDSFFREGATAHLHRDLSLGLAYANQEYEAIDEHTIDSLKNLLIETPVKDWPEFIYVHLIGVDSFGHLYGPQAKRIYEYLNSIDSKLNPIFKILTSAESQGYPVTSLLSTDHGMIEVKYFLDLQKQIQQQTKNFIITNPGRAADIYFTKETSESDIFRLMDTLKNLKGVDWVARRSKDALVIQSKTDSFIVEYAPAKCRPENYSLSLLNLTSSFKTRFYCPEEFDRMAEMIYSKPFIRNLAAYFNSERHADVLVLASDNTSFMNGVKGEHGGITNEESITPLLMRNVVVSPIYQNQPIPVFELLKFVK